MHMKAAVYAGVNQVEIRDIPMPKTADDEVLVKVEYCALCATDVHLVTEGMLGFEPGTIIGHEMSGRIVEIGANAGRGSNLKVGDRVCAIPSVSCGRCRQCQKGNVARCELAFQPKYQPMDAMTEYRTYWPSQLLRLPDDVTLEQGALVEPISTASRGIELADMVMGGTVLMSGAGSIGLIMLELIKLQGGTRITVSDPVPEKRQMALDMGAQYVIDPLNQDLAAEADRITEGMGYDYIFEMSGVPSAATACLDLVGTCGKIIYFAVYPESFDLPVNLNKLYQKEASLQAVFTNPYLFPRSVDLLQRIDTDKLIGPIFPLDDIAEAIKVFKQAKYPKLLIKCSAD